MFAHYQQPINYREAVEQHLQAYRANPRVPDYAKVLSLLDEYRRENPLGADEAFYRRFVVRGGNTANVVQTARANKSLCDQHNKKLLKNTAFWTLLAATIFVFIYWPISIVIGCYGIFRYNQHKLKLSALDKLSLFFVDEMHLPPAQQAIVQGQLVYTPNHLPVPVAQPVVYNMWNQPAQPANQAGQAQPHVYPNQSYTL